MIRTTLFVVSLMLAPSTAPLIAADIRPILIDTKGMVTDHLGQPFAGVTVELIRQRFVPQTTRTAAIDVISSTKSVLGWAFQLAGSVNLAQGEKIYLRGFADGKGYSTVLVQTDAAPEQRYVDPLTQRPTGSAWILLMPAQTIRGIVVDQAGEPIPNCEIAFPTIPRESVHSGADGTFQIELFPDVGDSLIPDRMHLEFLHPQFVAVVFQQAAERARLQQPDGSLRVKLSKGVLLTGTMTDEANGQPLSGAGLSISGSVSGGQFRASIYADALGKYSFRVPSNSPVTIAPLISSDPSSPSINFAPVGKYNQLRSRQTFSGDKETAELNFTFRKGQTVSGQVKLSREIGPRELYIDVTPADGSTAPRAYAERDGKFTVHGVVPGNSQIAASYINLAGAATAAIPVVPRHPIEVTAGQDLTDVEMVAEIPQPATPVSTFHGKVFNADGLPAALARASAGDARELTGLDGSFTLRGTSADVPFIIWVSTGNRETAAAIEIPKGTEPALPLEVHLLPSSKFGGRILDGDEKPVVGAQVALVRKTQLRKVSQLVPAGTPNYDQIAQAITDSDGKYVLRGFVVPENRHDLQIETYGAPGPAGEKLFYQVERDNSHIHIVGDIKPGEEQSGFNFRITKEGKGIRIKAQKE